MSDSELESARKSLERVQEFDPQSLPRVQQLGEALNFAQAVEPARKLINLFNQYPSQFLSELPSDQLNTIRNNSDQIFNLFEQILSFNPSTNDPTQARNQLIAQLNGVYQSVFSELQSLIAYGASRQRDFSSMERDFRAAMQRASDQATESMQDLIKQNEDAKRILEEVRQVAAEQGVSQKAHYFKTESEQHARLASIWRNITIGTAILLSTYAALSFALHKIPYISPSNTYETIQLGISKMLIFAVLAYMLLLCARNFLSHTHNEIVNRHRQNALLTFNALADAAGGEERRDVILTYAAMCIFSPQETGYVKTGSGPADLPVNIIQSLPKMTNTTSQ